MKYFSDHKLVIFLRNSMIEEQIVKSGKKEKVVAHAKVFIKFKLVTDRHTLYM